MANITTSFPSFSSLEAARSEITNSSLSLMSAISTAYNAYNNAFSYSYARYDVATSSKVAGYLTNGAYAIGEGSNLLSSPATVTYGYYATNSVGVDFYGSVSRANAYSVPSGYLSKVIVSSGNAVVTVNGYVNAPSSTGSLSSFEVKNGQTALSGAGDFALTNNNYQLLVSGAFSSFALTTKDYALNLSGISADITKPSSYNTLAGFLSDVMNGNDNVTGTNASEYLFGFAGNDNLSAGYGDDTLDGGMGNDILDGGLGSNTAVFSGYKSSYSVSKSGSSYLVNSFADGSDTLSNIQFLQFTDGIVAIDAMLAPPPAPAKIEPIVIEEQTPVVETISTTPTNGDDFLTGTNGNDKLSGLLGNDTLIGGLGADRLQGHKGADTFKFNDIKESGKTAKTRDTIVDFKHKDGDKIDLSEIDANTSRLGNQAFSELNSGEKFSGKFSKTGQLFFETKTGILYGNVDTKTSADFSIQLNGVKSLVIEDLVL